ncbi:MAG: VOC family protein [Parvularculaceae bacterium]
MAALTYATIGSNDLVRAKKFYDELLGSIGLASVFEHPSGGRIYGKPGRLMLGVLGPHNGEPASPGNGNMFAFTFDTRDEVDAFYKKALSLGATDEGAPGERGPKLYFSYFRDLDGNKLCGFKLG